MVDILANEFGKIGEKGTIKVRPIGDPREGGVMVYIDGCISTHPC